MTPAEAIAQLKQLQASSEEALLRAEMTVMERITAEAKQNAPEDTGALVESIGVEQTAEGTTGFVAVPYSGWVEFGGKSFIMAPDAIQNYVAGLPEEWQKEAGKFLRTGLGKMPPHPFFYPAVQAHQEDIYTEADIELQKLAE